MKRYAGTLSLVVIAAALGAYLLLVEAPKQREMAAQRDRENLVFDLDEGTVTSLEIVQGASRIVMARNNHTQWVMVEPVQAPADSAVARRLLSQVTTMERLRSVAGPVDAEEMGFVGSTLTVGVMHEKGRSEVTFGATDPVGSGVYARLDDGSVVLTTASAKSTFEITAAELRRKEFVDFDADEITEIVVMLRGKTVRLRREKDEWYFADSDRTADPEPVGSLLNRLRALRATEFVDDSEGRTRLGVPADPWGAVTLTSGKESLNVTLYGGSTGGSYVSVGTQTLFVVSQDVLADLPLNAESFRDLRVVRVTAGAVTDVEVERDGETYRIMRGDVSWKLDGTAVSPSANGHVEEMVRALTTLRGESIVAENRTDLAASVFDPALARITLRNPGKELHAVLTLGSLSDGRRVVTTDDGPVFAVADDLVALVPLKSTLEPRDSEESGQS